MSLPVIVITTSSACGTCKAIRGDGQPREPKKKADGTQLMPGLIKGGYHWSPALFTGLLTGKTGKGPARYRVYEPYFTTLGPKGLWDMVELNEFTLKATGGVTRTTYSPSDDKKGVMIAVDGGTKTVLKGASDFGSFVARKIPVEIMHFLYLYPNWIYVNGAIWDGALRGANHLYAYPSSLQVTSVTADDGKPKYGIDTKKPYTSQEDPVENAALFLSPTGAPKLLPPTGPNLAVKGDTVIMPTTAGCTSAGLGYKIVPFD
jgi:hypothetical protein